MKKVFFIILSLFFGLSLSSCELNVSLDNLKPSNNEKEDKEEKIDDNNWSKEEYICSIFGEDIVLYNNDVDNPYNIDLDEYADDCYAAFYDPVFEGDPYKDVTFAKFYENYKEASSYEDSYYRSQHGFMSGDITPQEYKPKSLGIIENDKYVKCSSATYILDTKGNYIAYVLNDLSGKNDIIYYGGAYTSLNEVSAYLLAFGELPVNSDYDKSYGVSDSISLWKQYGRVNNDYFSGNTNTWPYEPELPEVHFKNYTETDFGTTGGYSTKSVSKSYYQTVYNNGRTINRGAARLVFVSDSRIKSIDERYVFYTYNHYNDFQEYLNYNDGFGLRFGNESAGNQYCASRSDFYNSAKNDPTDYPKTINKKFTDLIS